MEAAGTKGQDGLPVTVRQISYVGQYRRRHAIKITPASFPFADVAEGVSGQEFYFLYKQSVMKRGLL